MPNYLRSAGMNANYAFATTVYSPSFFSGVFPTATLESAAMMPATQSGIASLFSVRVRSNSLDAASTYKSRKNGAYGNCAISVPAGLTGVFTDLLNHDDVRIGDSYEFEVACGGTTGTTLSGISHVLTSETRSVQLAAHAPAINVSAAGNTTYWPIFAVLKSNTLANEARLQFRITTGCVASKFQVNIRSNARSSPTVVTFRVNGAAANQTVTIPAGATGIFVDLTNTDTLVDGDLISARVVSGTGTGVIAFSMMGVTLTYSGSYYDVGCGTIAAEVGRSTFGTFAMYPFGVMTSSGIYPQTSVLIHSPITVSRFRAYIFDNTCTSDTVFSIRKNNITQTGTFTVPAGATGYFEDSTHSDSFAIGDVIHFIITGGTSGSMTISNAGYKIRDDSSAPSIIGIHDITGAQTLVL